MGSEVCCEWWNMLEEWAKFFTLKSLWDQLLWVKFSSFATLFCILLSWCMEAFLCITWLAKVSCDCGL